MGELVMSEFIKPDFSAGSLELRVVNGEICIYGTKSGLNELANLCKRLIDNPKIGHLHLEDRELLTEKSNIGVIAVFNE